MSNLPALKYHPVDLDGVPLGGGKLYFYEAGTTTPFNTYSDEALTSPNANPVIADGTGRFGEIYLDPAQEYKIKLTESDDSLVWTIDDIKATELAGTSITARVKQIASTPLDYGAIGDGVADESAAVQAAIDAAAHDVDLLGGTYSCTTALTLKSGITIKNGTLDFYQNLDAEFITATGTKGSTLAFALNASKGDDSVVLGSTSGLVHGDVIRISSAALWDGVSANAELAVIRYITGGTVYILGELHTDHLAASSVVEKITPVEDVAFRDVTIMSTSSSAVAVALKYTNKILFERVTFRCYESSVAELRDCLQTAFRDCMFEASNLGGVSTYGVLAYSSTSETLLDRCSFDGIANPMYFGSRDAAHIDGQTRDTIVRDCLTTRATTGVYGDTGTNGLRVDGCRFLCESGISGSQSGVVMAGVNLSVARNTISTVNGASGIGVKIAPDTSIDTTSKPWRFDVLDNQIDCGSAAIGVYVDAGVANEPVFIRGNSIENGLAGVQVLCGDMDIAGNRIKNTSLFGVYVLPGASGVMERVSVRDNDIEPASGGVGIDVHDTADVRVSDNRIIGNTGASSKGIVFDAVGATTTPDNIRIDGNDVRGVNEPMVCALDATNVSENLKIAGNSLIGASATAGEHGLEVTGALLHLSIVGNHIEAGDTTAGQYAINLDASLTPNITSTIVSGNTIAKGEYGLVADADCVDILHDGNAFNGYGTAATLGAFTVGDSVG